MYNFSIKQVRQYDKEQNKQHLFMSDLEFRPIHKFFRVTISSIKYKKNSYSDMITSIHIYNTSPYKKTLPLGLLGYCEKNATISPTKETAYRVNNILHLLDICQSTILDEYSFSSIIYIENSNSDVISLHVYNNSPYKITLLLGLLGYCETNATTSSTKEVAYRVNIILHLLDICQSTILDVELSINNILSNEKRNTDYFTKTTHFKPTFQVSNYTEEQRKFLTMFNFQHSQITQKEFEQLADFFLKCPKVYATSKFDDGKVHSSLHLALKPDAVFKKKTRASKVPIHLQDKVNRWLEILE